MATRHHTAAKWLPHMSLVRIRAGSAATTCALGLGARLPAADAQQAASPARVFDHATIVDVETGKLVADQRIVIEGSRIRAVGASATVNAPAGAQIIDATGKYVIPGLWDMHSHIFAEANRHASLIANGVTGIREMSGTLEQFEETRAFRRESAAGAAVGPRVVATGHDFYSPVCSPQAVAELPIPPDSSGCVTMNGQTVTTPDEVRTMVDSVKAVGVDFVKAHAISDRKVYFAYLAEARRVGIPDVGHLGGRDGFPVTEVEASDSGIRTIEHIDEMLCWQERFAKVAQGVVPRPATPAAASLPDSIAESQCREAAEHFKRNGTWLTPTLYVFLKPSEIPQDYQAKIGPSVRRATALLHRVGMPMLAGTDAHGGDALLQEVILLTEIGMKPIEALRTATLNPAQYLGMTDSLGTIAPGKLADLVLLDADPLTDIQNVKRIRAVVANGRYFDRAALDKLLADYPLP